MTKTHSPTRTRSMSMGAALGTAAAVLLGAIGFSGLNNASAEQSSGDRPVFISINPCRVTDTRPSQGIGGRTTPIGAAETHDVNVRPSSGDCFKEIPMDALSVQLNVTALNASEQTYLTLHPTGAPQPTASALNPAPNQPPTPNSVTTAINSDGDFSVYNNVGSVDVLIDISGYYVGHNHNDDRPTRIQIGHTEFEGTVPGMPDGRLAGSGFIGSASNQCMIAHLPLTADMRVNGVAISFYAPATSAVTMGIVQVRHEPGTGLSFGDLQSPVAQTIVNGDGLGTILRPTIAAATPINPDLATYGYYVLTCGDDPYVVTGASIDLSYA